MSTSAAAEPHRSWSNPALALAEVVLVFALVHFTYRALKAFTGLGEFEGATGSNFVPGLVMIGGTLCILLIREASFSQYGLTWHPLELNLSTGCLAGAMTCLGLIGFALLLPKRALAPHLGMAEGLAGGVGYLLLTCCILLLLRRKESLFRGVPVPISLAGIIALVAIPILLGIARSHRSPSQVFLAAGWNIFGSGLGEETFFRGYVQSRLNGTFGKPWQWLGVSVGPGLFIASGFFALIHVLNTTDYFRGHFEFAWWFGVLAFGSGIFLGVLREKTNSVLAPTIAHGLGNTFAQLAA